MKNILLYLWQLPQNLLGLAVILFTGAKKKGDIYHTDGRRFGVSLGNYIIFGGFFNAIDKRHEQGHQKQSLYLGWLYLLVIGLPSAIGNIISRFVWFDYYRQPWEAWADKLGNVDRGVERC